MSGEARDAVMRFIDTAFENMATGLDQIAMKHGMKSDEMMRSVSAWGDFETYYADWIQASWENWEPLEGDA